MSTTAEKIAQTEARIALMEKDQERLALKLEQAKAKLEQLRAAEK